MPELRDYQICQLFGTHAPEAKYKTSDELAHHSYVGVEVEIENAANIDSIHNWDNVSDGSLRNNGRELRFSKPLKGGVLVKALRSMEETLSNYSVETNGRTGLHVHIDVSTLTLRQAHNFCSIALMLELALIRSTGNRIDNIFCIPSAECISQVYAIGALKKNRSAVARDTLQHYASKYAGINLASIPSYGTVEFRMHEGTTSAERILHFVNVLLSVKKFASDFGGTAEDILNIVASRGALTFSRELLGKWADSLDYNGVEADLERGVELLRDASLLANLEPAGNSSREVLRAAFHEELGIHLRLGERDRQRVTTVGMAPQAPPLRSNAAGVGSTASTPYSTGIDSTFAQIRDRAERALSNPVSWDIDDLLDDDESEEEEF